MIRWLAALSACTCILGAGLAQGVLSGRVTNERGEGLAGVDLDFIVSATGKPENSVTGDTTDAFGFYTATIKPDVYDVYYSPFPGQRYGSHVEHSVDLTVNQTIDVVLRDAVFVTGLVTRSDTGGPAISVDLDFEDLATGIELFTPLDNTGLDGRYKVAVPKGIYEVTFDGPEPNFPTDPPQLAPRVMEEITITLDQDVELPPIVMDLGYNVNGEVVDEFFVTIPGVDLDVRDSATRELVFTLRDNTDGRGRFDTVLPAGTYDFEFEPPLGQNLAATERKGVVVQAPVDLGTEVLPDGWDVFGSARDPLGNALWNVKLLFQASATGAETPTAWDRTSAVGRHDVYVALGTYDVTFLPRASPLVGAVTQFGVAVGGDTPLGDTVLPAVDTDADGVGDLTDNCPFVANLSQTDSDADAVGDACDVCPAVADARQLDNDGDGLGNACDPDDDGDGVADAIDSDDDGDGIADAVDLCPGTADPAQRDADADGAGDACDGDDGLVDGLALAGDTMTWRPEAGAISYNVYRQQVRRLSVLNLGTCEARALAPPLSHDDSRPAAGEAFSYLVTANLPGGEGSLGHRADGAERPNLRRCP